MKEIVVSYYMPAGENAKQWETGFERLKAFCERLNPRLGRMEAKLKLREVIMEDMNDDALMSLGMCTIKSEEMQETAAEQLLGLELDFELREGAEFPQRVYIDKAGNRHRSISDSLLTVAVFKVAFGAAFDGECDGNCSECPSACAAANID